MSSGIRSRGAAGIGIRSMPRTSDGGTVRSGRRMSAERHGKTPRLLEREVMPPPPIVFARWAPVGIRTAASECAGGMARDGVQNGSRTPCRSDRARLSRRTLARSCRGCVRAGVARSSGLPLRGVSAPPGLLLGIVVLTRPGLRSRRGQGIRIIILSVLIAAIAVLLARHK